MGCSMPLGEGCLAPPGWLCPRPGGSTPAEIWHKIRTNSPHLVPVAEARAEPGAEQAWAGALGDPAAPWQCSARRVLLGTGHSSLRTPRSLCLGHPLPQCAGSLQDLLERSILGSFYSWGERYPCPPHPVPRRDFAPWHVAVPTLPAQPGEAPGRAPEADPGQSSHGHTCVPVPLASTPSSAALSWLRVSQLGEAVAMGPAVCQPVGTLSSPRVWLVEERKLPGALWLVVSGTGQFEVPS